MAANYNDRRFACPGLYNIPLSNDGGICRIKLPFGHIDVQALQQLSKAATLYGNDLLELTSRANIQIRAIAPDNNDKVIACVEAAGLGAITRYGDGIRNIMLNPTNGLVAESHMDLRPLAQKLSHILQTNPTYSALSPKFSIYLDAGEYCAKRSHKSDLWVSVCNENTAAIGLNSAPQNGTPYFFVARDDILPTILMILDTLCTLQSPEQPLARMRDVVGNADIFKNLTDILEKSGLFSTTGYYAPVTWKKDFFLGIHPQSQKQQFYLGFKPFLGRLSPQQTKDIADLCHDHGVETLIITPLQSCLISNLHCEKAQALQQALADKGFIVSAQQVAGNLYACAGKPACAKAKADVLGNADLLAQSLPETIEHPALIHLTGCPKSCAANFACDYTLEAQGDNLYTLYEAKNGQVLNDAKHKFGHLLAQNITLEQSANLIKQRL